MFSLNNVLQFTLILHAARGATLQSPLGSSPLAECPWLGGSGVVRVLSGDPHAGLYLSTGTASNGAILTTQSLDDAMHVSLVRGVNPAAVQILNPAKEGYGFLGLATNKVAAAFGPKSTDYTALTYISDPRVLPKTSYYGSGKTVVKGLWTIGINGELLFDWDHTDGSVYRMTHSVQMNPARLYETSNLDAYINYWFPNNASGHAEVTLVYEPIW